MNFDSYSALQANAASTYPAPPPGCRCSSSTFEIGPQRLHLVERVPATPAPVAIVIKRAARQFPRAGRASVRPEPHRAAKATLRSARRSKRSPTQPPPRRSFPRAGVASTAQNKRPRPSASLSDAATNATKKRLLPPPREVAQWTKQTTLLHSLPPPPPPPLPLQRPARASSQWRRRPKLTLAELNETLAWSDDE